MFRSNNTRRFRRREPSAKPIEKTSRVCLEAEGSKLTLEFQSCKIGKNEGCNSGRDKLIICYFSKCNRVASLLHILSNCKLCTRRSRPLFNALRSTNLPTSIQPLERHVVFSPSPLAISQSFPLSPFFTIGHSSLKASWCTVLPSFIIAPCVSAGTTSVFGPCLA